MLIINADDWGMSQLVTDNILNCYINSRITSTTAMMFMNDTERSAELALLYNIPVGLHLNLTDIFTGNVKDSRLVMSHKKICKYYRGNKYSEVIYNPKIIEDLKYSFKLQYEEFIRFYKKPPTHIDGHHHLHLSANIFISNTITKGIKVRRGFSLDDKRVKFMNRIYHCIVNLLFLRKYVCTDYFYGVTCNIDEMFLREIIEKSKRFDVEIMVHPGVPDDYIYLNGEHYYTLIIGSVTGSYNDL